MLFLVRDELSNFLLDCECLLLVVLFLDAGAQLVESVMYCGALLQAIEHFNYLLALLLLLMDVLLEVV